MTWPEAFVIVGVVLGFAWIVHSVCKWLENADNCLADQIRAANDPAWKIGGDK